MTLKVDTFVVTSDVIVITHHHPHPQNEGMMVQCVLSSLFFSFIHITIRID